MPLIIPPGFVQASFVFSGVPGTAPYVTTLGIDSSDWGGDFVGLANTLKTDYFNAFGARTNNDLTLDRVTLYIGDDGPSGSVDSDTPPIPMTASAEMAPTAMALIVRKQTASYGRRGRGRMFLPGTCPENVINENGGIQGGYVTTINTALGVFYTALTEGVLTEPVRPPVLFHGTAPADPDPITAFTLAPLVGWIRGRIR